MVKVGVVPEWRQQVLEWIHSNSGSYGADQGKELEGGWWGGAGSQSERLWLYGVEERIKEWRQQGSRAEVANFSWRTTLVSF